MKNCGIKITYSWGDEESLIECSKENAWRKMLELAMEEIRVDTEENKNNTDAIFYYDELRIILHYHSDGQYCYYNFVEDYEDD